MVFAVLLVLALTACQHPPSTGTVTSTHYHPSHTDLIAQSICVSGYKGSLSCHIIWQPVYYPASWDICLRGDRPDSDGHVRTGCIDVDQRTYHEYVAGDHYPRSS